MAPRCDDGKSLASDIFTDQLLQKSYIYLSRPRLSILKKKLDARETLESLSMSIYRPTLR